VPGVLGTDLASFVVAIVCLLVVPAAVVSRASRQPETGAQAAPRALAYLANVRLGWAEVKAATGLRGLLGFQAIFSFLWSLFAVLVSPMLLGFTDARGLGLTITVAGGGMLAGSLAMSATGGPKKRLTGLLGFELASAVAFVGMGLRPSLVWVCAAAFLAHFTLAFVSGLDQALWQSRMPQAVLGRVLGLRQLVVKLVMLLAYLLAGSLADRVLGPVLSKGGLLAGSLGRLIGIGPGRGIAALFILIGLVKAASVVILRLAPGGRDLESQLLREPFP
jgi:hypothetical protein